MQILKNLSFKTVSFLAVFSQSVSHSTEVNDNSRERKISLAVNYRDGINREEAESLAYDYFYKNVSGCGYLTPPLDKRDQWEMEMRVGYAGVPSGKILVDKKDGSVKRISYPGTRA